MISDRLSSTKQNTHCSS